jgi:hypothetical protein
MSAERPILDSPEPDADYELAAEQLVASVTRRSMLTRGAAGGLAVSTSGLLGALMAESAQAAGRRNPRFRPGEGLLEVPTKPTKPLKIFQIATIAEQLAVTFYSNGVKNADKLGLEGSELQIIKAAGIEEQIHQQFFTAVIGVLTKGKDAPLVVGPTKFSFPFENTFTDLRTFIATQQVLEGVFDSAFLAAVRELSVQGLHRAAQIAAQVAAIESEHRALGRSIAAANGIDTLPNPLQGFFPMLREPNFFKFPDNPEPNPVPTVPADDWAFAPVFFARVSDAPKIVEKAGFLSPRGGNSFRYDPIDFTSPVYKQVFEKIFFREPLINIP